MDFGMASVAAITVIAYAVGLLVRAGSLNNKWIPVICGAVGAVLGVAGLYVMPDFPAQDVISGRYGSGEVRKAALGADYYVVQAQVNRILGR